MDKSRSDFGWSSSTRKKDSDYASLGFLVVDDDPGIQDIVSDVLRTCGAKTVMTANNGEEAIAKLTVNHDRCHIIISDCNMKPMNGLELLAIVRSGKLKDVNPKIPFIMITGNSDIPLVKKAKELAVNGFLAKPVSLDNLNAAVKKALADQR